MDQERGLTMSDGNVVAVAENFTADVLHELLQLAIEGKGPLPGAKHSAKQLLAQRSDVEAAIARMIAPASFRRNLS